MRRRMSCDVDFTDPPDWPFFFFFRVFLVLLAKRVSNNIAEVQRQQDRKMDLFSICIIFVKLNGHWSVNSDE